MSKTKAELQEELEVSQASLAAAVDEIEKLKDAARKSERMERNKATRKADQLEEERKRLYAEAQDVYTQALNVARDVYQNFEEEVEANLGLVAQQVRSQVMATLKQVFGDEL